MIAAESVFLSGMDEENQSEFGLSARKAGGFALILGVKIVCEDSMERTRP